MVILPYLSRLHHKVFFPNFSACLILPLFIIDVDVSNIKGTLPVGTPKQIGFVPNKDFLAPYGARAGGALVKQNTINFFLTACSA